MQRAGVAGLRGWHDRCDKTQTSWVFSLKHLPSTQVDALTSVRGKTCDALTRDGERSSCLLYIHVDNAFVRCVTHNAEHALIHAHNK